MVNLDVGIQQDAPVQWKSGGRLANQGVWKGEVLAIQVKGRHGDLQLWSWCWRVGGADLLQENGQRGTSVGKKRGCSKEVKPLASLK